MKVKNIFTKGAVSKVCTPTFLHNWSLKNGDQFLLQFPVIQGNESERKKMSKNELPKVAFKAYEQHQTLLFPPALSDMIDGNHPVRVVSDVIDRIDISPLMKAYKGGGSSSIIQNVA